MRHCAMGRHRRYRPRSSFLPALLTAVTALALFFSAGSLTGIFSSPAAAQGDTAAAASREARAEVPGTAASQARAEAALLAVQAHIRAAAVLAAHTYTVRSGDSISAVAVRHCGQARMWTGIYAASRDHRWTARNANQISSGQHLYLSCAYRPSMLRFAPAAPPPVIRTVAAVTSSTRAGSAGTTTARSSARSGFRAPARVAAAAGTYSYAGLEALWGSAGGPAWAAPHAAEIAECESGGRTNAYNPSGATGLWQILGSVVPGNLYNAFTNALNAVSKFRASGDTFAQWVCT